MNAFEDHKYLDFDIPGPAEQYFLPVIQNEATSCRTRCTASQSVSKARCTAGRPPIGSPAHRCACNVAHSSAGSGLVAHVVTRASGFLPRIHRVVDQERPVSFVSGGAAALAGAMKVAGWGLGGVILRAFLRTRWASALTIEHASAWEGRRRWIADE
jgi:hypothetical protein